jgi:hypothetical protein
LTAHSSLSIHIVKKIVLTKLKVKGAWIKFMLNEKIFDDKSRISEISILTEMIGMIIFLVEEKAMIFEYSGNSFSMIFSNGREFEDVELEVRGKVGIGDDVEFTRFGDRRIQKGEYLLEHNHVQLVKTNFRMERK